MKEIGRQHYDRYLDAKNDMVKALESAGMPPQAVTMATQHALTSPFPAPRYKVGLDALVLPRVRALVPDLVWDFAAERALFWLVAIYRMIETRKSSSKQM